MNNSLKLYNSITKKLEDLTNSDELIIFFNSLSPYDHCNIIHSRVFILLKTLTNILNENKVKTRLIPIFSLNNKEIYQRAELEEINFEVLIDKYVKEYLRILAKFKISLDTSGFSTFELIPHIEEIIITLDENNKIIKNSSGYYYEISKFENYTSLSGQNIENLLWNEKSINKGNFLLWKLSNDNEFGYPSKMGNGIPSQWLVSSAIIKSRSSSEWIKFGTAEDLFPHHENELAILNSIEKKPVFYIHGGQLEIIKNKGSEEKSLFYIKDLLEEFKYTELIYYILSHHYRTPLSFNSNLINPFIKGRRKLETFYNSIENCGNEELPEFLSKEFKKIKNSLYTDLNTSKSIGLLQKLRKTVIKLESYPKLDFGLSLKNELTVYMIKILNIIESTG